MIKKIAYLINRRINNNYFYNYFARGYFLLLDVKKFFVYGTTDMFDEICIETISSCNRKCSYCPVSKYNRGDYIMKKELFKKIIKQLVAMNFKGDIVHHFYGEPLLDKRLDEFVEYEKSLLPNSSIRIYTNGDFLTKKKYNSLANVGVDFFYVTLHFGIGISKFLKFYESLDIKSKKRVIVRKLTNDSLLSSRGGLIKVKNKERKQFCGFPSNNLVIDVHGNVVLCCEDYFGKFKWGNVKTASILKIWNKPKFRKIRKETKKGKFSIKLCEHCIN